MGPVKSGKSTLIDALLGEDLLPRGSGILTAQVTAVRFGSEPGLTLSWKSRPEVNRGFSALLTALGLPGTWDLGDPEHRRRAAERLAAGSRPAPELAPLRSLLEGFAAAWGRLGEERRREDRRGLDEIARWVTRDEVAGYLAGLEARVASPFLPAGIELLDCQGTDAWNAAHTRDVEETLLGAHAVVYVVSTRVGLREADFRLLETLRGYGLLELTRFVVNEDLSEARGPGELERVEEGIRRRLEGLGCSGEIWCFSALQGLLLRLLLLDPDALAPGERGLPDVWQASASEVANRSRETFDAFRERLWEEARVEGERLVLLRGRADLRRILVGAGRELRTAGKETSSLEGAAWEAETLDQVLTWMQDRLDREAAVRKEEIRRAVGRSFRSRRAEHRRLWRETLKGFVADPVGAWAEAGRDPVAAGAILGARLENRAAEILSATEPLRVNAVRNLALEARGHLARAGELLGAEAARLLEEAGLKPAPSPDRRALAREITATRTIPLFRRSLSRDATGAWSGRRSAALLGRALGGLGARVRLGRRAGPAVAEAEAAARRGLLLRRLGARWEEYVKEVVDRCLLPHVDEAAGQVFARLASWAFSQTRVRGADPLGTVLDRLDRAVTLEVETNASPHREARAREEER